MFINYEIKRNMSGYTNSQIQNIKELIKSCENGVLEMVKNYLFGQ